MSEGGTEQKNPLAKFGGSSDFAHTCDGCGNPTNNTPIPVRETKAVDIILCDTCETVAAQSICGRSLQPETDPAEGEADE